MPDEMRVMTLASLPTLAAGDLRRDFETTLAALVRDCMARPNVKAIREVKIVVRVVPIQEPDGSCDDVAVDIQVASKSPARQLPTYRMHATTTGGLRYSEESPDNPDQKTLFGDEDDVA